MPFALIPLLKYWQLIAGAAGMLALGIALVVARHDAATWEHAARKADSALATASAANAIQRGSIATLETALAAKNAESLARAKAYDDSKAASAADVAKADAAYRAGAGRRAAIEAVRAEAVKHPGCPVPSALAAQLSGL